MEMGKQVLSATHKGGDCAALVEVCAIRVLLLKTLVEPL